MTWLLLAAPLARAQLNLDFELADPNAANDTLAAVDSIPGWQVYGRDAIVGLEGDVARSGRRSIRVEVNGGDNRRALAQAIDARDVDGDRIRVSAFVRTAAAASAEASLRVRVDGGGRLLYIGRDSAARDADAAGWRRIVIDAPLSTRAERIEIGGSVSGQGIVWFDDFAVEGIQAADLPAPTTAARRYVEQALAVIDEHAVTRRQLDWSAYRAAVMTQARGASTERDAHLAVQFALAELGDGHSYFMSPQQMSRLDARPVGNARSGRMARTPRAKLLFDGIAYLHLPGIAGGEHLDRVAFAEQVQALIGDLAPAATRGWILDLRDNQGGNLWPMLAGIGPLLGDGVIGASQRPDGESRDIWYRDGKVGLGDYVQMRVRGEAVRLSRLDVPVAVLLNDETASAAEVVALAFARRAASRSFGAPSAGAITATRTFPLSDGAALMLAVARLTDRHGRPAEARVTPDVAIDGDDSAAALEDQGAVRAAQDWLGTVTLSRTR